ncbi:hypothetical protein MAR_018721, partial [Mya arenaria]
FSLRVKLKRKSVRSDQHIKDAKELKHERYVDWSTRLKSNQQKRQRKQMSNEQRNVYNEKCKERMKRYRQMKKEKGVPLKRRDYWRSKKKEQRSKWNEEHQRENNEKRRQRYHESKAKKKLEYPRPCIPSDTDAKAKEHFIRIPKKAERFAKSVSKLVGNCTPPEQRHNTYAKIVANVKLQLKALKQSQTVRGRQRYYIITKSLVGKHAVEKKNRQALDLKYSYWTRLCHLQEEPILRITPVSEETKESIKSFYIGESENIPTKRMATKKVMTQTLKSSHGQFLCQNQGANVSLSTFKKVRPRQVLTMDRSKFQSCLCEYCVNVEFKLEALNKICNAEDLKELKIENKFDCLKMTLCPTENEFNDKQCYERNCAHCGEEHIALHFQPLIQKCVPLKVLETKPKDKCL